MSTPRPTRSRFNSPAVAPPNNGASETPKLVAESERPKTFMDKWVEPSLAPPRPSFAEAGIERHGVVANMVPLGTRPSAKVLKAATTRAESVEGVGRGVSVKKATPSVSTPDESITTATPEPTTDTPRQPSVPTKTDETTPAPAFEAAPTPTPTPISIPIPAPSSAPQTPQQSPRKSVSRPSVIAQAMGQGVFALHQPQPPSLHNIPRPIPPVAPPLQGPPHMLLALRDLATEFTDKVVEAAVQEAIDNDRWPTAYALRTLYDEQRNNPRMVRLIDDIYSRRADDTQVQTFKNVMRHKKNEGRKDNCAYEYFNGDGSDPPPQERQSSAVHTRPSPYSTPSGRSGSGARPMSDVQARRPSFPSSMSASPHKEYDHSHHVSKKHKGNNFQATDAEVNGSASASPNGVKTPQKQQPLAQQNGTSNSRGRARSRSNSSSSSLSSVDEQVLDGELSSPIGSSRIPKRSLNHTAGNAATAAAANTQARFTPYANNSASAETLAGLGARNQTQPITAHPKPGPKTYTFSTVATTPSPAAALPSSTNNHANTLSPNSHHHHPSSSNSMAPAALLPSATILSSPGPPPPQKIFKLKKDLGKIDGRALNDENDMATRMKRDARRVTEKTMSAVESFERHQISAPVLEEFEFASDGGDSVAPVPPAKRTKLRLLNKKSTRQSGINYDSDSLSSPTLLSFQPDVAPGSLSVSRAGTPNTANRPTRKPKTGTGLRVKTSPMKKKGGTLAGIPRASGERNSPVGNGAPSNIQDDNDDYCSSCGGNGDLVCCDGCTRSFHFKCVDPPMSEDSLPEEWLCNLCQSKVNPRSRRPEDEDPFGILLGNLERKNPSAFHLPKDIRDYFENVKTGPEGEYEEVHLPKSKNRGGYDDVPDFFRMKDTKGKIILCHQCRGAASAPDRAIIPCGYCSLYWHLDCLDPPLAKEPATARSFRCPAHINDLLALLPDSLGPAHRRRKIKGASVIRPAIVRGHRNNGDVEIENDPTDDEEEQGFYELREYGRTYKLPESAIKLDFISRVRAKTGAGHSPSRFISQKHTTHMSNDSHYDHRSLTEKQAALNLVSLGLPAPESSSVNDLINTLMAKASPEVLTMIAQGDAVNIAQGNAVADSLSESDRSALNMMKAFIESRLAEVPASGTPPPSATDEKIGEKEPDGAGAGAGGDEDVDVQMLL